MDKAYKVKEKNCDGFFVVGSIKSMYSYLYHAYVHFSDKQERVYNVVKWARKKSIGAKFEDDVLSVEVVEN